MDYNEFIESKKHIGIDAGITPVFIPDKMFDFQKYIAEKAIKKGRNAIFLDTGLGKTLIELVIANNYVRQTNKKVLILTPLAVAFQFLDEAEKFAIDDVKYSRDGQAKSKITLCNYENLHKFNYNDFNCVICDESSILKNFDGATKNVVTEFMKKVEYRYLATATPSPNDYIELGTSSEALGYMGYVDMLTKYFKSNNNSLSPTGLGVKFVLKGHAYNDFFAWVNTWAISARKPSDLGFSDINHTLPELIVKQHIIHNSKPIAINGQSQLFNSIAQTLPEIRVENKNTVKERCDKAMILCENYNHSVYWVNLNEEGDYIQSHDTQSLQIKGSMSIDKKEEYLTAFSRGEIKRLITKPKITSFGLNWQHCNHSVFFPTYSYEQYYQAIRRFWRFGQTKPVTIDLVLSDGQQKVLESIKVKSNKANEMFDKLNKNLHKVEILQTEYSNVIQKPLFLGV